jgi:protein-S-isoprenylcysteine O-methyltransferase Ste14
MALACGATSSTVYQSGLDYMTGQLEAILFVVLSGVAVISSLHAWRAQQSYGFFRFIGFEALVLLVVWNANRWFREPLSFWQVISWFLLAIATALAAHGVRLLRVVGKAQRRIIEDTQTVVEVGAYRYIRHPLYAALIMSGWGIFFKGLDFPSGALATVATGFLIATARSEERFNMGRFGLAYTEYMSRTKMFIPFLL